MIAAMQPTSRSFTVNREAGIGNNEVPRGVGRDYFVGNYYPDEHQDRNRSNF
jgi:hypothetical protein